MKYVYNIKVNFNYNYIDFYEWNESDKISTIHNIPIIKVSKQKYKKLLMNIVQFDKSNYIQLLGHHNIILVTNGYDAFALKINNKFISSHRSSIGISDELDILHILKKIKVKNVSFKIKKCLKQYLYTREERNIKKYVIKKLKQLSYHNNNEIQYLHYEYLNTFTRNNKLAMNDLLNSTNNPIIIQNLYNYFH